MKYIDTNNIDNRIQKMKKQNNDLGGERKKVISISLSADLNDKLNAYCKENFVNKSLFIENAIREYVDKNAFLAR